MNDKNIPIISFYDIYYKRNLENHKSFYANRLTDYETKALYLMIKNCKLSIN